MVWGWVPCGSRATGMISTRPVDVDANGARMTRRWMTAAVAVVLATGVSASAHAAVPATPTPEGFAAPVTVASSRSTGPVDGCVDPEPTMLTGRLASGRTYLFHLPARYDPRRPYPVILAYHGRSQQARDIEGYSGLDSADALVLYPQGRRIRGPRGTTAWEGTRDLPVDGKDVAFTRELLGVAGRAVCTDPQKVSAVGASQGGGFAAVLACTAPGTVSAIAAVAGAFYRPEAGGLRTCRSGPLRVLEFHGTADPVIDDAGTRRSLPIGAWLDEWARRDGCRGGPGVRPIPPDVTEFRWDGCAAGSEVLHYRVTHGNHGWPGGGAASVAGSGVRTETISATTIMLRFLQGLPVGPPSTAGQSVPLPALPRVPAAPFLPRLPLEVRGG